MATKRLPDKTEAATGAKLAAANARALLDGADRLAGDRQYGSAGALAVLALEEAVKARTLGAIVAAAAQGRQPGFSETDLTKIIYKSHKHRHDAGLIQHIAANQPKIYHKLMLGQELSPVEKTAMANLIELLASADVRKQAGFYTDFDPDTATWSSPNDIGLPEYETVQTLVNEFVVETERQIDTFFNTLPPGK